MSIPWIYYEGVRYSLSEELKPGSTHPAFQFCIEWLNGRTEFELQTSGSTGEPKKIKVTRPQLISSAQLTLSVLGLQPNETALVCLDIRYIAGIMMLVRALEGGLNIVLVNPSANPFESIPDSMPIDFVALVPYQVEAILKSDHGARLDTMKVVLIGGAPVSEKLKTALEPFRAAIYSTYGMTETLSHIALQRLSGAAAQKKFQALAGISLSRDERGCLIIQAPHLREAPIVTNDLVELYPGNSFRWLGRIDHVINSGGIKIFPEEIEHQLQPIFSEFGLSNRFFIMAAPDSSLGEVLMLVVEGTLDKSLQQNLLASMKQKLPAYRAPRLIETVSHFVNTETGKVNRPKTIALVRGL